MEWCLHLAIQNHSSFLLLNSSVVSMTNLLCFSVKNAKEVTHLLLFLCTSAGDDFPPWSPVGSPLSLWWLSPSFLGLLVLWVGTLSFRSQGLFDGRWCRDKIDGVYVAPVCYPFTYFEGTLLLAICQNTNL